VKIIFNLYFLGQAHLIMQPEDLYEGETDDELPLIGEQLSSEHEDNLELSKKKKKKTKVIVKDDKKLHKDKHHHTKYVKKDHKDHHKEVYIKKDGKKKGYTKIIHKSAEVGIVNENSQEKG
jgi:hypothetical protein